MKLLFLVPPSPEKRNIIRVGFCSHEAKSNYLWQPSDLMILSSHLTDSDNIVLIDGTADKLNKSVFLKKLEKEKDADMVILAFSSVCWENDYSYFKQIKEIFKNKLIFVFGDVFLEKTYQEKILKECDGIIINPFVINFEEMAKVRINNSQNLNGICLTPDDNILEIIGKNSKEISFNLFPKHELFINKNYIFPFAKHFKYASVSTTWGCPFNCSYCSNAKSVPYIRNYNNVLAELAYLKKLKIKEIFFFDASFGYPSDNIKPLLEEMVRFFNFSWSCYFNPQMYTPELLEEMKKAGCHTIIIGVESAKFDNLESFNRKVQKEKIEELILHADKIKINVCADFILGLENETKEDILNTINYALSLPLDYASFNIASPIPGSSIRKKAMKETESDFGEEGFDTLGNKKVLGNDFLTSQEILMMREYAIKSFYLRPSYLLRRLSRISSFEHLLNQFFQMVAMFKKF